MGAIDRRKHDIDVMERVLGSAREPVEDENSQTQVVDIGLRPWLVSTATSAVHFTVGAERQAEDDQTGLEEREHDPYESDRRGEHTYPPGKKPAPRSHRERDELKSRLERRS